MAEAHTSNPVPRNEQLADYIGRITAGCPCDTCDLRQDCAKTGKECGEFRQYVSSKSVNSKRGGSQDARD